MRKSAREVAHTLLSLATHHNNLPFYIVAHADADGITAAAIIGRALLAQKIQPVLVFTDSTEINEIVYYGTITPAMKSAGDAKDGIWIFIDTGSTSLLALEKIRKKIIIDHHCGVLSRARKTAITTNPISINNETWTILFFPQMLGIEPSSCTAAFLTYLIAKNVFVHKDNGSLAVIGSLGDGLHAKEFTISGVAREAVAEATAMDEISIKRDLVVPGKETLPLKELFIEMNRMLEMGLGDQFIAEIGRDLRIQQRVLEEKRWIDLSPREKRKILSWFAKKRLARNQDPDAVLRMVGEVYHLKKHRPGIHLHDCAEFGKLLNECGEKGLAREAYNLCLEQTEENYKGVLRKLYFR